MTEIHKSQKLANVCYDIRGPVLDHANLLEEEGQRIIKLNIGNPGAFGFDAPDEIMHDVIHNIREAQGYCHSKGLFAARKAVMQKAQTQGIKEVDVEDVIMGNGVSELIVMAMQGLLNSGDEILIPSPDYPLWTASVSMAGGTLFTTSVTKQTTGSHQLPILKVKSPLPPRVSWLSTRIIQPVQFTVKKI